MSRWSRWSSRWLALLVVGGSVMAQVAAEVQKAYADAAAAIESIDYGAAIYGRFGSRWPNGDRQGLAQLDALVARSDPDADLLLLLGDADAKVRTLAMLVLFDRGDARHLPKIAALRDDAAATLSSTVPNSVAIINGKPSGPLWRAEPCTVGRVAQQCIVLYLEAAGVRADRADAFAGYWEARKDRTHCASWLAVELLRAHGGGSPVPKSCEPAITAVKKKVMALPTPDRELLLLALPGRASLPEPCDVFATQDELLAAARVIGDDGLLAILGGTMPSSDPDLPSLLGAVASPFGGCGFEAFVLDHSHTIFSPSSAPKLLAFGAAREAEAPGSEADWVAVAASLQPDHADEWIRAAYARVGGPIPTFGRSKLLIAMYDCVGDAARPWIAEQFWLLEEPVMSVPMRFQFVDHLAALAAGDAGVARERARAQLRAIVERPAFADCDPLTLQSIARAVDRWQREPILGVDELRRAWHPLGLHALLTKAKMAAAQKEHPKETAQLQEIMAAWRTRIAAAVAAAPK